MFKKYVLKWDDDGSERSVEFFVHSKSTRGGFMHRACAIGPIPRLDDIEKDWTRYCANEDLLFRKRVAKCSYCNRTWEGYSGQTCLSKLWNQLDKLSFVDMSRISPANPFDGKEPEWKDVPEPDELFGRFSR